MSQQYTQVDPVDQVDAVQSPGDKLRVAREARGLSVYEVAGKLKLDAAKIVELENGDVSGLGAPVFVTGYLRAYARLLDLPAEQIAGEFTESTKLSQPAFDPASSPATQNYGKVSRALPEHMTLSDSSWVHPGIVVIIIVVLLGAGYYVWDRFNAVELVAEIDNPDGQEVRLGSVPDFESTREENALSGAQLSVDSADGIGAPAISTTSINTATSPATTEEATPEPTASAQHETAAENSPSMVKESSPAASKDTDSVLMPADKDAAVQSENVSSEAQPDAAVSSAENTVVQAASLPMENARLSSAKREQLTLFLSDESWLEITDAAGERLIYRLGKAGEVIALEGIEPFNVMLGYVPAVRIMLNGEPYDLSAYTGRRSARFQLRNESQSENQSQNNGE